MSFKKVSLFGFELVNAASVDEVAADVMQKYKVGTVGPADTLITPNASTVVYYNEEKNRQLKEFYSNAAYILPDGMPLVWLSKIAAKEKLAARLTGSDLFPVLWQQIKFEKAPVNMVLANDELAAMFCKEYALCKTSVPIFFDANDEKYIQSFAEEVAVSAIANGSKFIFLGLNFPKQELLGIHISAALEARAYKPSVLILLLGASFEYYFDLKKRAPAILRKAGMEWFYRFMSEPGRLWKRYTVDNARFIWLASKEIFKKQKRD